jgi:CDGSH iron-sulfur domain-containing protein 3
MTMFLRRRLETSGRLLCVKITLRENGSIGIETNGTYTIRVGDREEVIEKARFSLCRCGHTQNSPFCDGSHKANGFTAAGGELEFEPVTDTTST